MNKAPTSGTAATPGAKHVEENPSADQMKGDIEKRVKKETEQGYVGVKVDPVPNEEYTLTTGPDSPPAHDNDTTRTAQYVAGQDD